MEDNLTQKQRNLLKIICNYIDEKRISPTNRELMNLFGLKSTSTMHGYLKRLKDKGYITWQEGMPRTIQILKTF
jgi:repressor LexA